MEEQNKKYTVSDFTRYHNGTMPAKEMHALEKAALEDPFLADALEGYALASSPASDISELKERLEEKTRNKKIFSIASLSQYKWWSIAALFLVMLGTGYLVFRSNNNGKTGLVSGNGIRRTLPETGSSTLIPKDTGSTSNDVAFEAHPVPELSPSQDRSLKNEEPGLIQQKINSQLKAAENKSAISPPTAHPSDQGEPTIAARSTPATDTAQEFLLKGRVVNEQGAPVGYATILYDRRNATTANEKGEFSFQSSDSSKEIIASAEGYQKKDAVVEKGKESTVSMAPLPEENTTVMTTSPQPGRNKKQLSVPEAVAGKVAGVRIEKPALQPFPLNEEFNKYLHESLQPVYDTGNTPVHGTVLLAFNVDKNGTPQKIEIINSTCKPCEDQAIRLLKSGPRWNAKEHIRGTAEIVF